MQISTHASSTSITSLNVSSDSTNSFVKQVTLEQEDTYEKNQRKGCLQVSLEVSSSMIFCASKDNNVIMMVLTLKLSSIRMVLSAKHIYTQIQLAHKGKYDPLSIKGTHGKNYHAPQRLKKKEKVTKTKSNQLLHMVCSAQHAAASQPSDEIVIRIEMHVEDA